MRKVFFSGLEFLSFFLQKMDGTRENSITEVRILLMFVWRCQQEQELAYNERQPNHITIFALSFSFKRMDLRSSARKASFTSRISFSIFMILFFRFLFSTIRTLLRCFSCCRSKSTKNKNKKLKENATKIYLTTLFPQVASSPPPLLSQFSRDTKRGEPGSETMSLR